MTIIGLPLGLAILNNIPSVIALQGPNVRVWAVSSGGTTAVIRSSREQYPFILRAVYFVLIGWWWSGLWLALSYLVSLTIILLPVGLGMFRLAPFMTTLKRY